MNPWLAALLGLVLGICLTAAVVWWQRRRRAGPDELRREFADIQPQAGMVLGMLRAGALIVGAHDEVAHSNAQARTWGLVKGDRVGVPEVLEVIRRARRTGGALTEEVSVRRGLGAKLHLLVRVGPLEGGAMVVLAEDRAPLLRVDETRRDFVANVSHELKTPIGAVTLLAEAVGEAADDPEAVRHFAGRLHWEADRLGELVKQIIALSRLQSSDPGLEAKPVKVVDLAASAVERCREQARARQVKVVTTGAAEVTIMGDAAALTEAVTNLLSNAITYSDERARVVISHRVVYDTDGDMVEIAVADNGIGITPADQERIFERFYRVDYGRSRDNGGTGLGLSIVKHVVAAHDGTVNVWSRVGQGSTFTLRFPVAEVDEADHDGENQTADQPREKVGE